MAGLDTAVKVAYAVIATDALTQAYIGLHDYFIDKPNVKTTAANIEKLAKTELGNDSINLSAPSEATVSLASELDKLRLNPKYIGDVINQMHADRATDPSLPAFDLAVTDNPGIAGAIVFAKQETNMQGGSEKQLIFPLTNSGYEQLHQNAQFMAEHKFEVVLPQNFVKADPPIYFYKAQ